MENWQYHCYMTCEKCLFPTIKSWETVFLNVFPQEQKMVSLDSTLMSQFAAGLWSHSNWKGSTDGTEAEFLQHWKHQKKHISERKCSDVENTVWRTTGRGEELTVNGRELSKQKINIIWLSNQAALQVFTVIKRPKSFHINCLFSTFAGQDMNKWIILYMFSCHSRNTSYYPVW